MTRLARTANFWQFVPNDGNLHHPERGDEAAGIQDIGAGNKG